MLSGLSIERAPQPLALFLRDLNKFREQFVLWFAQDLRCGLEIVHQAAVFRHGILILSRLALGLGAGSDGGPLHHIKGKIQIWS